MIALHPGDHAYPAALREPGPPPGELWIDGDHAVFDRPSVAIVGTRRMTPYGERIARELAAALASAGAVIVSGLAPGIDCAAHASAIDADGSSVAVLGEGITSFLASAGGRRRRLAAQVRSSGALVSIYPPVKPAQGWMFAKRNAVIAALGRAVVVVEAPAGSGALITAVDARRLGRPLFAVPGPVGARSSEGSNALIANGLARACLGPDAVGAAIGVVARTAAREADGLLDALAAGPLDIDELERRTRLERGALRARLVALVLSGAVVDRGDGRFGRSGQPDAAVRRAFAR